MAMRYKMIDFPNIRITGKPGVGCDYAQWVHIANSCLLGLNTLMDFMAENGAELIIETEERPLDDEAEG